MTSMAFGHDGQSVKPREDRWRGGPYHQTLKLRSIDGGVDCTRFGHWVGQLGDGRVATLGEIRAVCNRDNVTGIASTWCGNLIEVGMISPPTMVTYETKKCVTNCTMVTQTS